MWPWVKHVVVFVIFQLIYMVTLSQTEAIGKATSAAVNSTISSGSTDASPKGLVTTSKAITLKDPGEDYEAQPKTKKGGTKKPKKADKSKKQDRKPKEGNKKGNQKAKKCKKGSCNNEEDQGQDYAEAAPPTLKDSTAKGSTGSTLKGASSKDPTGSTVKGAADSTASTIKGASAKGSAASTLQGVTATGPTDNDSTTKGLIITRPSGKTIPGNCFRKRSTTKRKFAKKVHFRNSILNFSKSKGNFSKKGGRKGFGIIRSLDTAVRDSQETIRGSQEASNGRGMKGNQEAIRGSQEQSKGRAFGIGSSKTEEKGSGLSGKVKHPSANNNPSMDAAQKPPNANGYFTVDARTTLLDSVTKGSAGSGSTAKGSTAKDSTSKDAKATGSTAKDSTSKDAKATGSTGKDSSPKGSTISGSTSAFSGATSGSKVSTK